MHVTFKSKTTTAQSFQSKVKTPAAIASAWKPQACGLTREELRKIVLDALG